MDREQKIIIGKTMASLLHYSIFWEDPMDGDDVEDIMKACTDELNSLNGNE